MTSTYLIAPLKYYQLKQAGEISDSTYKGKPYKIVNSARLPSRQEMILVNQSDVAKYVGLEAS